MPAILAVAYLLVLQSALGAFALGAGPAVGQLDAFGNVICTHEGAVERPAGDPQHQHDCCLFGCSLSSFAYGALPAAGNIVHAVRYELVVQVAPRTDAAPVVRIRTPVNPRAPPAAA